MKTDNAIFYIKYYAKKHGEIIERKATLDDNGCGEFKHKKYGYPYFKYFRCYFVTLIKTA